MYRTFETPRPIPLPTPIHPRTNPGRGTPIPIQMSDLNNGGVARHPSVRSLLAPLIVSGFVYSLSRRERVRVRGYAALSHQKTSCRPPPLNPLPPGRGTPSGEGLKTSRNRGSAFAGVTPYKWKGVLGKTAGFPQKTM